MMKVDTVGIIIAKIDIIFYADDLVMNWNVLTNLFKKMRDSVITVVPSTGRGVIRDFTGGIRFLSPL